MLSCISVIKQADSHKLAMIVQKEWIVKMEWIVLPDKYVGEDFIMRVSMKCLITGDLDCDYD